MCPVRGMARERAHVRRRVKILADVNIAPRTCVFLRSQGHDLVRVCEVEAVNAALALVLPQLAEDVERGMVATFDGSRLRRRFLPIS